MYNLHEGGPISYIKEPLGEQSFDQQAGGADTSRQYVTLQPF